MKSTRSVKKITHPGIAMNIKYREYALKKGFKKVDHKKYMYGKTTLSICFYPCRFGIVVTDSNGVSVRKGQMDFLEFTKLVNNIIAKEDGKL